MDSSARDLPLSQGALFWAPAEGDPQQLMVLLHGVGASAAGMRPLAQLVQREFPQALVVAAQAPQAFEGDPSGVARQWFGLSGVTEANRPERVAAALPALLDWVRALQAATGVPAPATALWGFSQGAILALEAVQAADGLAGRVLAFAGRYAQLPRQAPRLSTLHLLHGEDDAVIPVRHAQEAFERLAALDGDATLDIAEGAGHEINGPMLQCAFDRLRSHIPRRTWAEALGAAPDRTLN